MFGLSLSCQLIQGPAVRTWNCVAHFANLLWYKFNHARPPIMPRSRRRHHSRSRTRSRSHSYDRDREPKRRKIESFDSPQHKRSLSPEDSEGEVQILEDQEIDASVRSTGSTNSLQEKKNSEKSENGNTPTKMKTNTEVLEISYSDQEEKSVSNQSNETNVSSTDDEKSKDLKMEISNNGSVLETSQISEVDTSVDCDTSATDTKKLKSVKSGVSPQKPLTPKQAEKRLQMEKQREEKLKERESKKQKVLEEKLKIQEEKNKQKQEKEEQKLKEKQEKQEQKQKEIEIKQKEKELKEEKKRKEREEKEQKRKEKEEREEQKRKEKEEKDEQKRKEQEEKQKQVEKKQRAAAAFVNFFTKKLDTSIEEKKAEENTVTTVSIFMPFEVKSDMKLAPLVRNSISDKQKAHLLTALQNQNGGKYLDELKMGKKIGKMGKTWLAEDQNIQDDVIIVEDVNPGESIEEQAKTNNKMKAKFLKFDGNRRPPYFGTWRKKSKFIKPRQPLALDKEYFDYEVDSDEEWEEEEDSGESLRGSDDEDKENESENEYEVDNEFFVPHGHLSDDEVNEEEDALISPEAHKAKLKLLKKEFEEERQSKTAKIKPRVIGCIWYNKNLDSVDQAIHEFLKPLSIISNGPVIIRKRSEFIHQTPLRRSIPPSKSLDVELIPDFLKFIHGSTSNQKLLIAEFLDNLNKNNIPIEISKSSLRKQLKQFAAWTRHSEAGPLRKKCWIVHKDVCNEYNVNLSLPC